MTQSFHIFVLFFLRLFFALLYSPECWDDGIQIELVGVRTGNGVKSVPELKTGVSGY